MRWDWSQALSCTVTNLSGTDELCWRCQSLPGWPQPWLPFSEFCLSLVQQWLQGTVWSASWALFSWNNLPFWEGFAESPRGFCPGACRGGQAGFWTPSVWEVATSFWAVAAILSGEGKLGTALPVLLVLLNCGMLVVDSVTFSVPCLPVFLYLLHLPLCQNAAIAKEKKKPQKKPFAFWLSLPLIICNCCVLEFFLNIIYSTYIVLMCF